MKDKLNEHGQAEYEKARLLMVNYWQDVYELPLSCYCFTLQLLEQAGRNIDERGLIIPYTNKSGATNLIENPYCKVYRDLSALAMKQAKQLGLPVADNQKIKSAPKQKKGFDLSSAVLRKA